MYACSKINASRVWVLRAAALMLIMRRGHGFNRFCYKLNALRASRGASAAIDGNMLWHSCVRRPLAIRHGGMSTLSMAWNSSHVKRDNRSRDTSGRKDRGFSKPPRFDDGVEQYEANDGTGRKRYSYREDRSWREESGEGGQKRGDSYGSSSRERAGGRRSSGRSGVDGSSHGGYRSSASSVQFNKSDNRGRGISPASRRGGQGATGRTGGRRFDGQRNWEHGQRTGGGGKSKEERRRKPSAWVQESEEERDRKSGRSQAGQRVDEEEHGAEQQWREQGEDAPDSDSAASQWIRGELSEYAGAQTSNVGADDDDTDVDFLYGIAPVLNALQNNRRKKLCLYCQDGLVAANKKDRAAAGLIYDLAREADVAMMTTDKGYLNTLCRNRPHQGFILKAKRLEFEPILFLPPMEEASTATRLHQTVEKDRAESGGEEDTAVRDLQRIKAPLGAAPGQVWLALDEITDPQNFGALLRTAHFFGASGVVTCAKNSAALTSTVSKASAGAAEAMRIHSTANMMRFLKRSRENGWRIVGTCISEHAITLQELPAGPNARPTIVVLGNEGYGVRTNVLRECDLLVEVAGSGGGALAPEAKVSTVDSLNVSVTGGVLLFHLLAEARYASAVVAEADAVHPRPAPGAVQSPPVDIPNE